MNVDEQSIITYVCSRHEHLLCVVAVQVRVCAVLSAMGGVAAIFTALAAGVYTVTITAK